MTALYWTMTGFDIWRMDEVTLIRLRNLNTGEELKCETMKDVTDQKFHPVKMPKIKRKPEKEKTPVKPPKPWPKPKSKNQNTNRRKKSKYKGVSPTKSGKFMTVFWDKVLKTCVRLGTFESELLAAAKYQEHIGNHKEARRLRNEYEEGDRMPEPKVNTGMQPGDFAG